MIHGSRVKWFTRGPFWLKLPPGGFWIVLPPQTLFFDSVDCVGGQSWRQRPLSFQLQTAPVLAGGGTSPGTSHLLPGHSPPVSQSPGLGEGTAAIGGPGARGPGESSGALSARSAAAAVPRASPRKRRAGGSAAQRSRVVLELHEVRLQLGTTQKCAKVGRGGPVS